MKYTIAITGYWTDIDKPQLTSYILSLPNYTHLMIYGGNLFESLIRQAAENHIHLTCQTIYITDDNWQAKAKYIADNSNQLTIFIHEDYFNKQDLSKQPPILTHYIIHLMNAQNKPVDTIATRAYYSIDHPSLATRLEALNKAAQAQIDTDLALYAKKPQITAIIGYSAPNLELTLKKAIAGLSKDTYVLLGSSKSFDTLTTTLLDAKSIRYYRYANISNSKFWKYEASLLVDNTDNAIILTTTSLTKTTNKPVATARYIATHLQLQNKPFSNLIIARSTQPKLYQKQTRTRLHTWAETHFRPILEAYFQQHNLLFTSPLDLHFQHVDFIIHNQAHTKLALINYHVRPNRDQLNNSITSLQRYATLYRHTNTFSANMHIDLAIALPSEAYSPEQATYLTDHGIQTLSIPIDPTTLPKATFTAKHKH